MSDTLNVTGVGVDTHAVVISRPATMTSRPSGTGQTGQVRETPAISPLNPTQAISAQAASVPEPLLNMPSIQGNVIPGFSKDFQTTLFLRIEDAYLFKRWLKGQLPFLASGADVLAFNRLFKAIRFRRQQVSPTGRDKDVMPIQATWFNISFSFNGLKILNADTDRFTDEAFRAGMTQRSSDDPQNDILGDPTDPNAEGNPANWMIGGPDNEADAVCIVAGDDPEDVAREIERIQDSLQGGIVLFQQDAANLTGDLHGHEHFGFLDGVSQPGIRGIVSSDPGDVLTPRQNPLDPDQGKPGQDLLWPGTFVMGYVGQDATTADITGHTANPILDGPGWAKDGSYLVFRRLRQDVGGFHRFLNEQANNLGISPDELGAKLVGRWHSGAPIMRVPDADNPTLGNDDCANNNFEFGDAKDPIPPGAPDACADNTYPSSQADTTGAVCPFAGHIRKSYPRDDDPPGEVNTQTHRLLRRGIPFGEQSISTPSDPQDDDVNRGLCFFCYQTSIVDQFEFVTRRWVNNKDFKAPGSGQDPIIGQNNNPADNRKRSFKVTFKDNNGLEKTVTLETDTDWVIPTGGGYFFTPSIEAIEKNLT